MFNNVAFDVVIGLTFVYLLYSLLATILQEICAHVLNLRSRMLNKAIRRMLEDDPIKDDPAWIRSTLLTWFYSAWNSLLRFFQPYRSYENFARLFYQQPSIKYLGQSQHSNKPSYLQADNFSATLVQMLRGPDYDGCQHNEATLIKKSLDEGRVEVAVALWHRLSRTNQGKSVKIPPETLLQLRTLFSDARQDTFVFRKRLEDWFTETMDRASGWYKKQTQIMLFLLGLGIAISFNVDTVRIYGVLAKDKEARQQIVNMAIQKTDDLEKEVQATKGSDAGDDKILSKTYHQVSGQMDSANLVLGLGKKGSLGVASIVGILLTALALSLGAPFWFDLLSKFVQLRGAGPKPSDDGTGSGPTGSGGVPTTTPDGKTIRG